MTVHRKEKKITLVKNIRLCFLPFNHLSILDKTFTSKICFSCPLKKHFVICSNSYFSSRYLSLKNRKICKPHPFYVKSHWKPPVQPSVDLENYLEGVKTELAAIKLSKPKQNLPRKERQAIRELKTNSEINIRKADKGSTTVLMNKKDKIEEGRVQLDNKNNYLPLETSMV